MAQIVTITNPLTGQPTQVDQLEHTAQQIDDGLNIARGVSNPNLLDNWYFGNPVNQRGQTSYTGEIYGIDRWCGRYGGDMTTVIRDGYIEISRPNYAAQLRQYSDTSLAGKTITVSALCSRINMFFESTANGVDYANVKNMALTGSDDLSLLTFSLTVPSNSTGFCIALNSSDTNQSSKIAAAKLELGTQQTLAHQDANGNWVLNEIPDYGEQLARCQRYCNVIRAVSVNSRYGYGIGAGDNICVFVPINVPLRAVPSITMVGDIFAWDGITPYHATFRAFDSLSTNGVTFSITSTDMTAGKNFQLLDAGTGNSAIILDANL